MGLIVLYPRWNSIDLLCGKMPEKEDSAVILFAEAAYTGQRLEKFEHSNVAGDHVSGGQRYAGYRCERNTGAFVYYDKAWKFCYKNQGRTDNLPRRNRRPLRVCYKSKAHVFVVPLPWNHCSIVLEPLFHRHRTIIRPRWKHHSDMVESSKAMLKSSKGHAGVIRLTF